MTMAMHQDPQQLEEILLTGSSSRINPRAPRAGRCIHATPTHKGFYTTFLRYLEEFFRKVRLLRTIKEEELLECEDCMSHDAHFKQVFFYRHPSLSIDSTEVPEKGKVWLGLGKETVTTSGGRSLLLFKPVAIKSCSRSTHPDIVARMMAQMKPGSFIASAHECQLVVHGLQGQRLEDVSPSVHAGETAAAFATCDNTRRYWVSEAGICTLHDLFEFEVPLNERCTQAHRRLVKEVCVSAFHRAALSVISSELLILSIQTG
jgi:hypothetical protein